MSRLGQARECAQSFSVAVGLGDVSVVRSGDACVVRSVAGQSISAPAGRLGAVIGRDGRWAFRHPVDSGNGKTRRTGGLTVHRLLCAFILITAFAQTTQATTPNHYYNFDTGSGSTLFNTGTTSGANGSFGGAWSTNTPFSYTGNRSITTTSAAGAVTGGFSFTSQMTLSVWGYLTSNSAGYLLDTASARTLIYVGSDHVYFNGQNLTHVPV